MPSPLALARFSAGLTQRELAAAAGIATTTVVRLEGGENTPQLRTARAIAAVLGRSDLDYLFPALSEPTTFATGATDLSYPQSDGRSAHDQGGGDSCSFPRRPGPVDA